MYIASAVITLAIFEAFNLKDRRRVIDSVITVLGKGNAMAVADLSLDGEYTKARLGIVSIANNLSHAVKQREASLRVLDRDHRFEVIEIITEEEHFNVQN